MWLAVGLACVAGASHAADYKTLRYLNAPAPSQAQPLPSGSKPRPLEFAKVVIEPNNGEPWALAYGSVFVRSEDDNSPAYKLLTWNSGRVQEQTAPFKRVFDEELRKAGFSPDGGESLFGEGGSGADLKVGVLIDDMKGRFCVDCPNLFNRSGVPASVVMSAKWEVYSTLERKVVAKVTTTGGADYKTPLGDSFLPAVYEGFRDNVRQLLSDPEFRKLVIASASPEVAAPAATAQAVIALQPAKARPTLAQATTAVAVVFAADGSGSGFLISADGYLMTNEHVVGTAKYVKLKWSDGSESVGEVVRTDRRRDVALIKADAHGRSPLELRTGSVQQGEPVYAIGSPLGEAQQNTMTKGIVSATRVRDGLSFIQSDVAVTHGNSGGPLLDEKGRVIGLTESGLAPNGSPIGLNFFIPIEDALRALALSPAPAAPKAEVAAAPVRGHTARKP